MSSSSRSASCPGSSSLPPDSATGGAGGRRSRASTRPPRTIFRTEPCSRAYGVTAAARGPPPTAPSPCRNRRTYPPSHRTMAARRATRSCRSRPGLRCGGDRTRPPNPSGPARPARPRRSRGRRTAGRARWWPCALLAVRRPLQQHRSRLGLRREVDVRGQPDIVSHRNEDVLDRALRACGGFGFRGDGHSYGEAARGSRR